MNSDCKNLVCNFSIWDSVVTIETEYETELTKIHDVGKTTILKTLRKLCETLRFLTMVEKP